MRRSSIPLFSLALLIGLTAGACSTEPDPGADTGTVVGEDDATEGDATEDADRRPDTLETPDGDTSETPPPDTDTGVPDTDATPDSPDTDAGEVDAGPDCTIDSDSDGLTDCEERSYGECLDPHDGDSDDDFLGDLEEWPRSPSGCAPASSGSTAW